MNTDQDSARGSQPRVILWFPMRGRSTAFTRAISQVPSTKILFEPFYTAYAYGPERTIKGFSDIVPVERSHTFSAARGVLERQYPEYTAVFCKDCTSGMPARKYQYLPDGYKHTFLIRNPEEICRSLFLFLEALPRKRDVLSQHDIDDIVGYKSLHQLHNYLCDRGNRSLVIESNHLVEKTEETLKEFCTFSGLSWSKAMLTWSEPAFRDDWWFSKSDQVGNDHAGAYSEAIQTNFIARTARPDYVELPRRYEQAIAAMMPFYRELSKLAGGSRKEGEAKEGLD